MPDKARKESSYQLVTTTYKMTKTYMEQETFNYIECCIRDMADSYRYASTDTVRDHGAENAQRWYRGWIEEEQHRGYGAIQYAWIFLKVIDEDTYRELDSKLDEAYNYWYEKSWDIKEL